VGSGVVQTTKRLAGKGIALGHPQSSLHNGGAMPGLGTRAVAVALVAIVLGFATGARAGWGPDGVTVRATDAEIPMVVACPVDGSGGTFVAWQEMASKRAGWLRVQHLFASGDVDPAWPAEGALATTVPNGRTFLDICPDLLGGAYLIWTEVGLPTSIFVTRIDSSGQVADGWPATGKMLGAVNVSVGRPALGYANPNGLYVAWSTGPHIFVERFGPDGHGAGGWPDGPRIVSPFALTTFTRLWPRLASLRDGRVYVGWATLSRDTTVLESGVYLRLLTGAGQNAPGWPGNGRLMAAFRPEFLSPELPQSPVFDIVWDGHTGVWWFGGDLSGPSFEPRVQHLLDDGTPKADWPPEGRAAPRVEGYGFDGRAGAYDGLRVIPRVGGGAILEERTSPASGPLMTALYLMDGAGVTTGPFTAPAAGHESLENYDGGVFQASFSPHGAYDPGDPDAFLQVNQTTPPPGWTPWREVHRESVPWYGDIALAGAGEDGAVFFWSQVNERTGLFARRFNEDGQVTGVGPEPAGAALHRVRFVSGTGVVAQVAVEGHSGTLELYDLVGRKVAGCAVEDSGTNQVDVTIPGTASLVSGVYFVRVASERGHASGKVAVVR